MLEEGKPEFILGSPTSEYLQVRALRRTHVGSTDFWDGNWLTCRIEAAVGGFKARVDADLRSEEFVELHDQLSAINERLSGEAKFTTLEGWLAMDMSIDRLGHVTARCELLDEPGVGNRLDFTLNLDQTYLSPILAGLKAIILAFPVLDPRTK